MIITIDGVAASGKSTVASGVARALAFPYVSSGLLYRAAARLALNEGLSPDSAEFVEHLKMAEIRLEPLAEQNVVWQGAHDISDELHHSQIDAAVSRVASVPEVREWVNASLRELNSSLVAEGRDMGTVVFPAADVKIYLSASARVRAERRCQERPEDVSAIEAALIERDRQDAAQSQPHRDALHLDTSDMTAAEVIAAVIAATKR